MPKHNEVPNAKLSFNKEAVANLSEQEMDQLAGGQESPMSRISTAAGITCCWCTSTRQPPVEAV
ncbi:class I lanthipeptide [Hymenobacter rubripertinctus]|uniref:RSAM-modified peptide n=1 Tax=Hymenobacter rubripertinctus TaxID=2029981 RepID=A0A418QNF2_9BACT|nr:class I lanthipeptide [Hymenobacter rubripertinctus]RIY06684.1 rSAM-modified peptide [Hymenobacter rubripertinctus]